MHLETFYYIPNLRTKVEKILKECDVCMRAAPQVLHPPLKPLVFNKPMECIEVDYFGPLPADVIIGHSHIQFILNIYFRYGLLQEDHYSGFVWGASCSDKAGILFNMLFFSKLKFYI